MRKVFLLFFGINIALAGPAYATESDNLCSSIALTPPADESTRLCAQAFCKLPFEDREYVANSVDFHRHVINNKEIFKDYLENCFVQWDDPRVKVQLQEGTKLFLEDMFGAIFYKEKNSLTFICSAFRIRADLALTARHCLYNKKIPHRPIENYVMRLIAAPDSDIPIVGELPNSDQTPFAEVANDFEDYWFLKLGGNTPSFSKNIENFRSALVNYRGLFVGGMNSVAFFLSDGKPEHWLTWFRFTRVAGAQWLPVGRLNPKPSNEAIKNCIYYGAPTFPGMSGSPIIASDFSPSTGKPPILFVVGMHLRSGPSETPHEIDSNCGNYREFNIGITLPEFVLNKIR